MLQEAISNHHRPCTHSIRFAAAWFGITDETVLCHRQSANIHVQVFGHKSYGTDSDLLASRSSLASPAHVILDGCLCMTRALEEADSPLKDVLRRSRLALAVHISSKVLGSS